MPNLLLEPVTDNVIKGRGAVPSRARSTYDPAADIALPT